jgi:hypothetical protein
MREKKMNQSNCFINILNLFRLNKKVGDPTSSIMTLRITIKDDAQCNLVSFSVIIPSGECYYGGCHNAECHKAHIRYTYECCKAHYTHARGQFGEFYHAKFHYSEFP